MNSPESTVVVIEDDANIADLVALYLRRDGFRVLLASSGERGLELVHEHQATLAIVDVGLAGRIDGFDVCRTMRASSAIPVVMLTARDDEIDRILGLELGADDYITKPFSPRELVARVHAILRRTGQIAAPASERIALGQHEIDLVRHEVRCGEEVVDLTAREFELLAALALNQGRVMSRRQLLDAGWGSDWVGDERTVDVHVRQLRKKLGDDFDLTTLRGVGYRLG